MSGIDFAPGDVSLRAPVPLTGVYGRTEREAAAACMVAACQDHGDWYAMLPQDIGRAHQRRAELSWTSNPFYRPDFHDLVAKDFARWVEAGDDPKRIEFTEAGLDRIGRSGWVVRSGVPR